AVPVGPVVNDHGVGVALAQRDADHVAPRELARALGDLLEHRLEIDRGVDVDDHAPEYGVLAAPALLRASWCLILAEPPRFLGLAVGGGETLEGFDPLPQPLAFGCQPVDRSHVAVLESAAVVGWWPGGRPMDYTQYQHLMFERKANGVVLITINRPEVLNATNDRLHWELTQVWLTLDADDDARVAVVTGAGRAFSAGGDLPMGEANARDPRRPAPLVREASDLVYNMINLDKPIVSAINGVAVGAGLVVALLSDVSIISETARFTDGHTKLGVVAGDHAAILWPLLCGMAKAKYYLLTSDFID